MIAGRTLRHLLAVAACGLLASPASAQLPEGWLEGLYDVATPGVSPLTLVVLVADDGAPLLPLEEVLDYFEVPYSAGPGDLRIVGFAARDTTVFRSSPPLSISVDGSEIPLLPGEAYERDGVWYMRAQLIAQLLGAEAYIEPADLVVRLERADPFPALQRMQVDRQRASRLRAAALQERPVQPSVPYEGGTGGAVIEGGAAFDLAGRRVQGFIRAGGAVLGGELNADLIARSDGAGLRASYSRLFPESRLIQRLNIGDVDLPMIQLRPVRGVSITNAPRHRRGYASMVIDPDLPVGWEFEVYRGGQLVDHATADGSVNVPVLYGYNDIEVRLYGPAGETSTSDYLYQVPPSFVQPGRFEYALAAGRCLSLCRQASLAVGRFGVHRTITIGAGFEHLRFDSTTATQPYFELASAPASRLLIEAQHLHRTFTRVELRYVGERSTLLWRSGALSPGAGPPSATPVVRRLLYTEPQLLLPVPEGLPLRSLRLSARVEGEQGSGIDRWRGRAGAMLRRMYVETELSRDRSEPLAYLLRGSTVLGRERRHPLLRQLGLSAAVQWADGRIHHAETSAARTFEAGRSLNFSARWHERGRGVSLSATFYSPIGPLRSHLRAASIAGTAQLTGTVSGGVVLSRHDSPRMVRAGLGAAGVRGRVYVDADGNGAFDNDDTPVADIAVRAGSFRVVTDSAGFYSLWGLPAYDIVQIGVDTLRGMPTTLTPAYPPAPVRLPPNMITRIDLPLTTTREVVGRLVAGNGVAGTGGMSVTMRNIDSGAEVTEMTFSNGEFYFSRVAPGTWEVTVAPSSLAVLQAVAEPQPLRFTLTAVGPVIFDLPPITILQR